jgi:alpha-amylase
MVSMEMDCSQTEGGWFEVKAYVTNGDGWETDVTQGTCKSLVNPFSSGVNGIFWEDDEAVKGPYPSSNHMGMCGYVNVFEWSSPTCTIESLSL